jgi:predicted outer membrane repeat protein
VFFIYFIFFLLYFHFLYFILFVFLFTSTLLYLVKDVTVGTSTQGSGVYIGQADTVTITNTNVSFISGVKEGAIHIRNSGLSVRGCEFTDVSGTNDGAGIYYDYGVDDKTSQVSIIDSKFKTLSGVRGGAVFIRCSSTTGGVTASITSSSFNSNTGSDDGGAIYIACSSTTGSVTASITSSNFSTNTARNDGGAIFFGSGVTFTINGLFLVTVRMCVCMCVCVCMSVCVCVCV